jgi:hypothetical protein
MTTRAKIASETKPVPAIAPTIETLPEFQTNLLARLSDAQRGIAYITQEGRHDLVTQKKPRSHPIG